MKRTLLLFFILAYLLSLAGCGDKRPDTYKQAQELYNAGNYADALSLFDSLSDYEKSAEFAADCQRHLQYAEAESLISAGDLEAAAKLFEALEDFQDSVQRGKQCRNQLEYEAACQLYEQEDYSLALERFEALDNYKDSTDKADLCRIRIDPVAYVCQFIKENGTETSGGEYEIRPEFENAKKYSESGITCEFAVSSDGEDEILLAMAYKASLLGLMSGNAGTGIVIAGEMPGLITHQYNLKWGKGGSDQTLDESGLTGETLSDIYAKTNFDFVLTQSSVSAEKASKNFNDSGTDMVHTMIEEFARFLTSVHPSLTLADMGLTSYVVDPNRDSGIRQYVLPGAPA